MTSTIEQVYQSRIESMSPKDRIAMSIAMFQWARELIGRQIVAAKGPMSAERLKWEIALRQYGNDPTARATIERKLNDVSG